MKAYTIDKPTSAQVLTAQANNGKLNRGHLFELAMLLHHTANASANAYRVDNNSYKVSCDFQGMELKTARATMGDIWNETLFQFSARRMAEGKAQIYAIGLDLVIDGKYAVIEMDAQEMETFTIKYGMVMDISSKNIRSGNSGKIVRLDGLRSKTAQESAWRGARGA